MDERAGREAGRGAEGVPVMRAREQLMRTLPGKCFGKAMGRVSKVREGEGLCRQMLAFKFHNSTSSIA